jgi:hypothetical protein
MKHTNHFFLLACAFAGLLVTPATAQINSEADEPKREIIVHAFRSPSIGVEYRHGLLGYHVGVYPTIIKPTENGEAKNTLFAKTGVTAYLFEVPTGGARKSEIFTSVSYLRGLNQGWTNAVQFEPGFRWAMTKNLDFRVGASFLKGADRPLRINPTIGVSWNFSRN